MSILNPFDNAKRLIKGVKGMVDNLTFTDEEDEKRSVFDEFTSKLPYEKSYRFTENSLIYGDKEYPYSTLNPFKFHNTTDNKLVKGVVATVTNDGKSLNLSFEVYQAKRITKAINYANEQIIKAKGGTVGYKYLIQCNDASKLEVYEDSIHLFFVPSGLGNVLKSGFNGGAEEHILRFSDIDLSLDGNFLVLKTSNIEYRLSLDEDNTEIAQQAIEYIKTTKESGGIMRKEPASKDIPWQAYRGSEHEFPLGNCIFKVSASLDTYNSYRRMFREYAAECVECFKEEFNRRVHNLTSYMEVFPELYGYYLSSVTDKALEIAISENIWTLTRDSLMEMHLDNFHLGMDDIMITYESVALTVEKNQQDVANITSLVPNLRGGGFGLKGAVKGIAAATAFNVVRDGVESSLLNAATGIIYEQQVELYNRVNTDILFANVFTDYMNMFLTLVSVLRSQGKDVWQYDKNIGIQYQNIFKNLNNPNFPKEQVNSMFIDILASDPYEPEYISFMMRFFGENEQTLAISEYFK